MKRFLFILIAVIISANIIADSTWTGGSDIFTHGSGTQSSPYQIETADQLAFIAEMVNGGVTTYSGNYFKLMTNINLNNIAWSPIGNSTTNCFAGHFDGNGFRVYNIKITSATYAGLFGVVSGGTFKNVTVQGSIPSSANATDAGGLIGKASGQIIIRNCINNVSISCRTNAGGIVGNASNVVITKSTNNSTISSNNIAGGIIGLASIVNVDTCCNNAKVSSQSFSGGIVGAINISSNSHIRNSVNNGQVASSSVASSEQSSSYEYQGTTRITVINYYYNSYSYAGGIVGYVDITNTYHNSYFQTNVHNYSNTISIFNCCNYGNITGDSKISVTCQANGYGGPYRQYHGNTFSCVGGIIGNAFLANVMHCFNKGTINTDASINFGNIRVCTDWKIENGYTPVRLADKNENANVGGIIGCTNQSAIVKCANYGNNSFQGFIGKSNATSNIAYSYNLGNVQNGFGTTNVNVSNSYNAGPTTNYGISSGTVTNSYYVSGSGSGTTKTDAQVKSVTMPILLNADSTVFLRDNTPYVNKGYPIFNGTFMKYVATNPTTNISYHTVTLNGNHINCSPSAAGFEYKVPSASSYTSKTCGSSTSKSYQLTNLSEGTKYIVRFWVVENGIKHYGDTVSFTTLACPPVQRITASICQGEYYEFGGRRLTTAGTYRDSFVAVTGCDSIIELVLNIYDTYKYTQFDTINRGESYEFYGRYLTEPGVYNEYIPITNRCNWVQLNLHVIEPAKTISLSVNDASMGSVVGAGTYAHGSVVAVEAHAAPGYHFIKWSDNNTDSIRAITLTSNLSLTAYFAEDILADSARCLRFKAIDGPATIALNQLGSPDPISLVISRDYCHTWTNYTIGTVIQLAANDVVYFRATSSNATFSKGDNGVYKFVMTGRVSADGNVMSLLNYRLEQTFVPINCFMHLFNGCSSLVSAPQLPAITVGGYAYAKMFYACTNLETMPQLPATNLSDGCYYQMFAWSVKLKTVVNLPATHLVRSCYNEMFLGCRGIEEILEISATSLSAKCCGGMFKSCSGLTRVPALLADTLSAGCYRQMFMNCTNLRTIPVLSATVLADSCYKEMFKGCSLIRLNYNGTGTPWKIPNAAASSASTALKWGNDMFQGTAGDLQGTPVVGQNYYPVLSVKMSIARNDSSMGTVTGEGYYAQGSNV